MKEDQIKKEESECTFKPQILESYKYDVTEPDSQPRYELLYNKGKNILSNKKNKTKVEIDEDVNGKECSFKPNTTK
jgi:hypothetical protein